MIFLLIVFVKKNHKCCPQPSSIQQGRGMCGICAGCDFNTSENNFFQNIEKLGGIVKGEYKGNDIPVDCVCEKNHKCCPRPSDIQQGQGMCGICKNKTERKLFEFLESLFKDVKKEHKPDFLKNPYTKSCFSIDLFIPSLNLFIELDGRQHFVQISNWCNPVFTNIKDRIKMKLSVLNGYKFIRIYQEDVYNDKSGWQELLVNAINSGEDVTYIGNHDKYAVSFSSYEDACWEDLAEYYDDGSQDSQECE